MQQGLAKLLWRIDILTSNNIAGKVVVITDASSELGASRVDRLKSLSVEGRGKALAVATDVTNSDQVKRLVGAAVQTFGRIDVMINNAGLMPHSPLVRLKIDDWKRTIDVNIKGVLYGIAATLRYMRQQKSGYIINVSSVAGGPSDRTRTAVFVAE